MNKIFKIRAVWKDTKKMEQFDNLLEVSKFLSNYQDTVIEDLDWYRFTGLSDKNNQDIYEGDFIKRKFEMYFNSCVSCKNKIFPESESVYEVIFYNGKFTTTWEKSCDDKNSTIIASPVPFEEGEIVGNIYKNPELKK